MLCTNPIVIEGKAFGCGQCLPCRVNKRRVWNHRILLESRLRKDNAFVTLTYSDENLPRSYINPYESKVITPSKPTLVPKHLQDWLKRFRKAYGLPVRYYGVGEYGDETERPHYHVMLFGFPTCEYGRSRYGRPFYRKNCCMPCDLIRDTWGLGLIDVGDCSMESAGYISGYVTKKMTGKDDFRLEGRMPEFARMSLRPGIGADFVDEMASELLGLEDLQGDVPSSLRHGSRLMPLGRYLTRRLRERTGRDVAAPKEKLDEIAEKLRPLREIAFDNSSSLKSEIVKAFDGARASLESRQRIYRKRGKI